MRSGEMANCPLSTPPGFSGGCEMETETETAYLKAASQPAHSLTHKDVSNAQVRRIGLSSLAHTTCAEPTVIEELQLLV